MATVTLTTLYDALGSWPGRLMEADDTSVVTSTTATRFSWQHGAGSDFEGFEVRVTGTGFTYVGGVPIGGAVTGVRVVNELGQTVVNIAGIAASTVSSDLSQLYGDMFGSPDPNVGPGPDGQTVWSHLLSGNDTFTGTLGDDGELIFGFNAGNDTFNMRDGDDNVLGGIGDDTIFGGNGFDRITFRETTYNQGGPATRGVVVDVDAGTILDPWGGTDSFTDLEFFEGSRFDDTFLSSQTAQDRFSGLRGRDTLDGGANTFAAGGGSPGDGGDRVEYDNDYWQGGQLGIIVNLQASLVGGSIRGTVRDGFGNTDVVIDIEDVYGTRFADRFVGSQVDNNFRGGEGAD